MKFEAITVKEIAKGLGVSTSTVSRAMRDSHQISPSTKEKILAYARKLNYQPNPNAQNLRGRKSRSIGVVVSEIANPFYAQAIDGIETVARSFGYNVIVTQTEEDFKSEVSALKYMASRSVDGVLLSVSIGTNDSSVIKALHQKNFPIVCFDRIVEGFQTHKVMVNNQLAAYEATMYLIKKGYTQIAHLASSPSLWITNERIAGFHHALRDSNIEFNDNHLRYCELGGMSFTEVEKAINHWMHMENRPHAVLAAADKLTIQCLRYCKMKNISLVNDLAIVGFSNFDLIDFLSPSIVFVRQPATEMGQHAAKQLFQLIDSKKQVTNFQTMVLNAELVE